jgi:hypothetical protein
LQIQDSGIERFAFVHQTQCVVASGRGFHEQPPLFGAVSNDLGVRRIIFNHEQAHKREQLRGAGGKQKALKAACQQNLQKIYLAAEIYAKDSAGRFPVVASARTSEEPLNLLVPRYTSDTSVFICPGAKTTCCLRVNPF